MNTAERKAYFESHPPSCISAFSLARLDESGMAGGHGEAYNASFEVGCRCGNNKLSVSGSLWYNEFYNEEVFIGPLTSICSSCSRQQLIIDTERHGHDAVRWGASSTARAQGTPHIYNCPGCGCEEFRIQVHFFYTDDLFDPELDSYRGKEQELFSWFTLTGSCPRCGQSARIADFEGA